MNMRQWRSSLIGSAFLFLTPMGFAQNTPPPQPPQTPPGAAAQKPPHDPSKPAGRLQLSTTQWDFGQVWYGETDPVGDVEIKNVGNAPLTIMKVQSSCGCTPTNKEEVEGKVLGANEGVKLKVSYHTKKKTGPINQTVTITSDDPVQPSVVVTVKGEVKALFEMEPREGIVFQRITRETEESKKVIVVNKYEKPMTLKLQPSSSPYFNLEVKELEAGQKWEVTATTKPPLPTKGVVQTEAVLTTGLDKIPDIRARVYAMVTPKVDVNRTELYVPKNMPRPMEQMIRVTYIAKSPIKITGVKSSLESIKAEVMPPPANAPSNSTFGWYDIKIGLPEGKEIPEDGATIEITTDAPEPEYAKFVVRVTNKPPQGVARQAPVTPAPGQKPGVPTAAPTAPPVTGSPAQPISNDGKPQEKKP